MTALKLDISPFEQDTLSDNISVAVHKIADSLQDSLSREQVMSTDSRPSNLPEMSAVGDEHSLQ